MQNFKDILSILKLKLWGSTRKQKYLSEPDCLYIMFKTELES